MNVILLLKWEAKTQAYNLILDNCPFERLEAVALEQ